MAEDATKTKITTKKRLRFKKPGKKMLTFIVLALLLCAYVATAYFFNLFPLHNTKRATEKKYETVQDDFQKRGEESCSDGVRGRAEDNFRATSDNAKKALLAEQIATCYAVKQKYDDAQWWYQQASDAYTALGNPEKAKQQQDVVKQIEAVKQLQAAPSQNEPEKDGMD